MGLTKNIKKIVAYGISARLIQPEDEIFMINQYLDLFGLDEYDDPDGFAGEWEDEFDDGYDEAYDYWEDEHD